jgi:hypothetical protein
MIRANMCTTCNCYTSFCNCAAPGVRPLALGSNSSSSYLYDDTDLSYVLPAELVHALTHINMLADRIV